MKWSKLLSEKRVRELMGGEKSVRDSRTEFERDYGRAVFSTPIRRLQDKTQVFPLEEHDAVRTRLTHSLEVSSVARNLGRQAGLWLARNEHLSHAQVHAIETVAATCGLIHDLGNPPFGHAGESAIQSWFRSRVETEEAKTNVDGEESIFTGLDTSDDKGKRGSRLRHDFLNWEGNAQTLRLISRLQVLADEFGLNMTCATFSAACKYIARSHEVSEEQHERSKPGFFASEEEIVARVAEETGTVGMRNPITYLVEASDDIVYSTGDLEDGVRKGLLDWSFLKDQILQFSNKDPLVRNTIKKAQEKVGFSPKRRPIQNEDVAQAFRTFSIGAMKDAVFETFRKRYRVINSGAYHQELVEDSGCEAALFISACKKVGQVHVYPSKSTLRLELMGRRVIHDLMDIFWEGARFCGGNAEPKRCKKGFESKAFALISSNYRRVFLEALGAKKLPERYVRLQLVTDQIAGMTDTYAITLHKRLMNG